MLWPVLLFAALLLGATYFLTRPVASLPTAVVQRGTIISSVETTGKLEAQNSATLSFRTSGRVERVTAKQGDRVKKGEVLAELDTGALERQLAEAQVQLEISRLKLQQAKQSPRQDDVAAAQAALNAAQVQLDQVKAGPQPEDVAAAQAALNAAQAKLAALKRGASAQELAAVGARLDAAKANRDLTASTTANTTEQARILYTQAAGATKDFLDPSGQLEQARLNYEAAKKSEAAQRAAADAKVAEAQAALDAARSGPTKEDLQQVQGGVAAAQAALDKVKKGAGPSEIASGQARLSDAQATLNKLKAGPTETELAILGSQLQIAQLGVDRATAQLDDARIVSPLDGTVLSISLDVGENVNGSQPVATVAGIDTLTIKADVDEIDVGRVSTGQPVTVTLDAYPGVKLPGKIESLSPGATLKQGSTVYQATISFTPTSEVVPREGMAANVDITAQRKDDVLMLPNRALETVGRRRYVTVKQGDGTAKVEVETGLSNNTGTEIISGLQEGQVVLLK